MARLLQHGLFVVRVRYIHKIKSFCRRQWLVFNGMKIGKQTNVPKMHYTWPHQVAIGDNCRLEHNIYFHYDGIWKQGPSIIIGNNAFIGFSCEFNITKKITIGNDCLIASGCKFIDHNHGTAQGSLMRKQKSSEDAIVIGNNVWLGVNVTVLKGITIGDGAVVAAGAVVTKSIAANEIWAGIPAKKIGER